MAVIDRTLGRPSGNTAKDIAALYDYIAYLTEQVNFWAAMAERRNNAAAKAAKEG